MLLGIALVALNLRPLVSSVGPVLIELRDDLGMSSTLAALVTTLPMVCFGLFGAAAPPLAARIGIRRLAFAAMLIVTAGLTARALTSSVAVFVVASTLALAGVGVANVVIPALVKVQFPRQVGLVTGVYTTLLQLSTATAAAASVPVEQAFGDWRPSLGMWAAVSLVAALPWIGLIRQRVPLRQQSHTVTARRLLRSRTAWLLTLFFAVQSANGYAQLGWLPVILRDAGVAKDTAGFALAMIPAVGIAVSMVLAAITGRLTSFRPVIVTIVGCYMVGYAGLLLFPATVPLLWSLLLGTGGGVFPMGLILIGLRARTGQGSSALSGFVQGFGYLVAAAGPFLIGALHGATGGWSLPVLALLASTVALFALGLAITKVRYVEDELGLP